jgi:hypothetical protein
VELQVCYLRHVALLLLSTQPLCGGHVYARLSSKIMSVSGSAASSWTCERCKSENTIDRAHRQQIRASYTTFPPLWQDLCSDSHALAIECAVPQPFFGKKASLMDKPVAIDDEA